MLKNVFETFPTFAVVRFRKARLETEALRHDALNMSVNVARSSGGYSWAFVEACAASLCVAEMLFLSLPATTCHPIDGHFASL